MKLFATIVLLIVSASGCNDAASTGSAAPDRDNTAVNERDQDATNKTPFDQSENQSDIDITAKIRQRIVDTTMSINAQNIKIITQAGQVTLRGPVETAAEKKELEYIAKEVAGPDKVNSDLEVERQ